MKRIAQLIFVSFFILTLSTGCFHKRNPAPANKILKQKPSVITQEKKEPGILLPLLEVRDQAFGENSLKIQKAVMPDDGWVSVRKDSGGAPGDILGYAKVAKGENKDIFVKIDISRATPLLYAMLHEDLGEKGTFEVPGADIPAKRGRVVAYKKFQLLNFSAR